jgi:hypothetical protein
MNIKQQHALAWFVQDRGYRLHATNAYPTYTFFDKVKHTTHVVSLDDIVDEYDTYLKSKERNRKARQIWRQGPKGIDVELI